MERGFGMNDKEQQLYGKRQIALNLIKDADWETLLQMAGFVFDEQFIRGHLIASMSLADEKQLEDFIEFFGDMRNIENEDIKNI